MSTKCNRFLFLLVAGLYFHAFPVSAIQGAAFERLKIEIKSAIPEAIVLKDATFTATQIAELGDAMINCTSYLNSLSLIGLKDSSKKTEDLFAKLKRNTSLYVLELNDSYLSDAAMNALIDLLTPSENNKSHLERISLDGVRASAQSWLNLASAMEKFDLQEITLRGIIEVYANEDNSSLNKQRLLSLDPMLKELENSLGNVARLSIVLAINSIKLASLLDDVQRNTRRLVKIRYDNDTFSFWWATAGLIGAAGIFIAYADSKTSAF